MSDGIGLVSVKQQVYMRESRRSHRRIFHRAIRDNTSDSPRPKAVQKKRRSSLSSDKKHSEDVRASSGYTSRASPTDPT